MHRLLVKSVGVFLLWAVSSCHANQRITLEAGERPNIPRRVSVTIDDLPVVGTEDLAERQRITRNLLDKLTRFKVPAVGFVNERKLYSPKLEPEEVALLKAWLDAGLELANHSYSHLRFEITPLDEFKADVLRGEIVTRELMAERGMKLRYFRHPFLNIGDDQDKIDAFNYFLVEHNYITAPVSVSNSDWLYSRAYVNALRQGDEGLAARVADDYVRYMEAVFLHVEQFTRRVLGREPAQILLLHANRLNADHFHRIAELIAALGYDFITLEEALKDKAYAIPGIHNEPSTMRALDRMWRSQTGEIRPGRPPMPGWIRETAGADGAN